ncbi:hypothetical protein [uncultured Thiodictyon sp.]|uniref:hypothetical protein n=1 Tax=uncultured Thiodictyon sp. TaxID=1846217 RepID=UPI0025CB838E|nr:hypothetical protein [uncultured Thiodictyon sp.]
MRCGSSPSYDPIAEMDGLAAELLRRFPLALVAAPPIQWTSSLDHLYAGLVMLADWLGSSLPVMGEDWRPEAVATLLDSLPWSRWHSGAPATAILPGAPIGAQVVIGAVPLAQRLVVFEAPTGTGKTEAALLRALAGAAAIGARRALPADVRHPRRGAARRVAAAPAAAVGAGAGRALPRGQYAIRRGGDRRLVAALLVGVIGKGGTRRPLAIVATQTAED